MKTGKMVRGIILSMLALLGAQLLSQLLASALIFVKIPMFIGNITGGALYIVFAYLLLKLLCQKYLKGDMQEYNIPAFKIKMKWVIVAVLLPLMVTAFYLLFVPGTFEKNVIEFSENLDSLSAGIFYIGFGAGIVEEMVFRGVMMSVIEKKFGRMVAVVVPSVLFGFVHILGMGFEILSCALVVLAGTMVGIMFSLIASETKSIWNSAIVHAFWNIIISGGIICVGTQSDKYSLYSYVLDTKSFVITGGEFGIESSAIALAGYGLVSLFVVLSGKKENGK